MTRSPLVSRRGETATDRGFSLVELLITVLVLGVVMGALVTVLLGSSRSKVAATNLVESSQAARLAVDMLARDLRTAGYGADLDATPAQPPIAYVDSTEILINTNLSPWPEGDVPAPPLAYDPAGTPRPRPLDGTAWEPAMRYRTGAELVRWTLDVNNDGAVDEDDVDDALGADAARTPNPDDFVLVRQVYGDSTGNVAGNNGGQTERIALVRRPGAGVAPLFSVYMKGSSTPWDWSNGPVPAAQLPNIERIVVTVTAPSARPDWRRAYTNVEYRTEVNSLRNTPDFGQPEYAVDGYVFHDQNANGIREFGEPGLANVRVRLGPTYTIYTNGTGYFQFSVPAGTYTLRHVPPPGYGVFTSPDSFVVTVPGPQTRLFADTSRAGGWVRARAFLDQDADGIEDAGEGPLEGIRFTMSSTGEVGLTDATGDVQLFSPPGAYTVTCSPPDSLRATTANPVSGTMTDGGTAFHAFGLEVSLNGKVSGRVFRDNNRNGVLDAGEAGIQNVYVGVTGTDGVTVLGFAYTNATGDYEISVPINDPPRTSGYRVFVIAPAGFYPTGPMALFPVWVQASATTGNQNFGMASFQVITLSANRVLSLASADLIEKDWNGNQTHNARADRDLVLGADAGGTDNVSVWFNDYNGTPLFTAAPTYTRNAPNSVLALAVASLDNNAPATRPDVVTGCRNALAGNFFVWFNQNSNGNQGYLPTAYSAGQAYRTADNGDVTAVLLADVAGGALNDIIVGTKSPTSGNGTIEVWQSNDAATPSYSRQEIYPPAGSIPGARLGEVTAMALADLDLDGDQDLVVGTKTGTYSGELLVFEFLTRSNGSRFVHRSTMSSFGKAITAVAVSDVDGDGYPDLVAGAQSTSSAGWLQYWRNGSMLIPWNFLLARETSAPGIVTTLAAADFGGSARHDIALGWRENETSYVGGVQIWFTDLGTLPAFGVDPSQGSVSNFVPASTTGNFNYGVQPSLPAPPYLTDLAVGVKVSSTTGALVVFIR